MLKSKLDRYGMYQGGICRVFEGDGGDGGDGGGGGGDAGFVGSDGTFNDGWTGREEFKANADTLGRFKNVNELANGYMAARTKIGKDPNSLAEIPNDTSSDEVRATWAKANGVPDSVDGYEYNYSDDFATKLGPLDDTKMAAIREFSHKELGLSPAKFQKLMDFYHANASGEVDAFNTTLEEQIQASKDKGMAILNKAWLDGVDDRTKGALLHLQKYGEIEVKGENGEMVNPLEMLFADNPELKNSPWLTMIADNMAQAMSEDTAHGGGGDGPSSLEGINAQIVELRSQQNEIRTASPVNFKSDPKFKDLEGRLKLLYQKKPA